MKDINDEIILTDIEKVFDNIQHIFFFNKNTQNTGTEGIYLNVNKIE